MEKEDVRTIINMLQEVKREFTELKQQVQILDEKESPGLKVHMRRNSELKWNKWNNPCW
jgi:hypothetical protein